MTECAAGHNFQEIADFCRCKFTEPLTDEIDRLEAQFTDVNKRRKETVAMCMQLESENKQLRDTLIDCMKYIDIDNLTMQTKWVAWEKVLRETDVKL